MQENKITVVSTVEELRKFIMEHSSDSSIISVTVEENLLEGERRESGCRVKNCMN